MKSERVSWWCFLGPVAFVIGFVVVGIYFDGYWIKNYFDAVNALFSGLAFAAFFYTILLQRHEIESQQKGMAEKSARENFFLVLKLHMEAVAGISITNGSYGLTGDTQGVQFFERVIQRYTGTGFHNSVEPDKERRCTNWFEGEALVKSSIFRDYESRILFLLSLIKESELSDKESYYLLLRSILTSNEILLILCRIRFDADLSQKWGPLIKEAKLQDRLMEDHYGEAFAFLKPSLNH